MGKEYVLAALERILPDDWVIAEYREGTVPRHWDGAREALLGLLGPEAVAVDELVRRCHLSPAAVSTASWPAPLIWK